VETFSPTYRLHYALSFSQLVNLPHHLSQVFLLLLNVLPAFTQYSRDDNSMQYTTDKNREKEINWQYKSTELANGDKLIYEGCSKKS